jgi:hypothetical protein
LEADHQNKPDIAASLTRKWFNDGIQAVADGGSSGAALAVRLRRCGDRHGEDEGDAGLGRLHAERPNP